MGICAGLVVCCLSFGNPNRGLASPRSTGFSNVLVSGVWCLVSGNGQVSGDDDGWSGSLLVFFFWDSDRGLFLPGSCSYPNGHVLRCGRISWRGSSKFFSLLLRLFYFSL